MLEREELTSLKRLAFAIDQFEPFADHVVPAESLQRFIALGLVERGPSIRPAVGSTGYRLTSRGWAIVRRCWGDSHASSISLGEAETLDA